LRAICRKLGISVRIGFVIERSGAYDFNSRRRRDDEKRRRVEAAVEELIRRYGLSPKTGQELSDGIYGLYRNLVTQKLFDDQNRKYRRSQHHAEQELAIQTANASGTDVSAYVADARELAARMIRLDNLERRNLGRGKAIDQASKVTWADLSPQEERNARQYLEDNVLPGDKTRQPAQEAKFLRSVAALIGQATGHRIRFSSSAPGSTPRSTGRHYGVEFDVMKAAAEMADYSLSNEAIARRIRRIRQQ
jgi:hypothetical protein